MAYMLGPKLHESHYFQPLKVEDVFRSIETHLQVAENVARCSRFNLHRPNSAYFVASIAAPPPPPPPAKQNTFT